MKLISSLLLPKFNMQGMDLLQFIHWPSDNVTGLYQLTFVLDLGASFQMIRYIFCSVVFAGFSAQSLRNRIVDGQFVGN